MEEKVCFLFGHQNAPPTVEAKIEESVKYHYQQYGVRNFIIGYHGNFDAMGAAAIRRVKKVCPDICIEQLLAYHPAQRPQDVLPGFDNAYYPFLDKVPLRYAIVKANQHMINIADYLICYVAHSGNSQLLLERAYAREKYCAVQITNLAENTHRNGLVAKM